MAIGFIPSISMLRNVGTTDGDESVGPMPPSPWTDAIWSYAPAIPQWLLDRTIARQISVTMALTIHRAIARGARAGANPFWASSASIGDDSRTVVRGALASAGPKGSGSRGREAERPRAIGGPARRRSAERRQPPARSHPVGAEPGAHRRRMWRLMRAGQALHAASTGALHSGVMRITVGLHSRHHSAQGRTIGAKQ